jgi:hypothetical protein
MKTGIKQLSMYCGKYAPWEHYPKNLRFSEVQYPLTVVKHFFDLDWPKGHFEDLKTWRYYVLNYESFHHERFGPGKLFDTYEATLKLLEALHLLFLDNEDEDRSVITSEKQLNEEKQLWYWFPENLSHEELMNPYLATKRVFKEIKPQQFRDYLNEWIHFALSTHAVEESMSMNEMLLVYKSVKKLYSAAWMIRQRESDKPTLKRGPIEEGDMRERKLIDMTVYKKSDGAISRIEQTTAEKLALKEVADTLLKAAPSIKSIIHINSFKNPDTFMLYLLVGDTEKTINEELNKALEKAVAPLIRILTVIESESILQVHNGENRAFLRYVLAKGIIVYEGDSVNLKEQSSVNLKQTDEADTSYHEQKLAESITSYDKIDNEIEAENLYEAVGLIARSLTAILEALLFYKTGYKTATPDIDRLSWLTQLFTNEIERRFDHLANVEPELYELLISTQPDYSGSPPDVNLPEVLKLKIELVNQRMIVRTLMAGDTANGGLEKSK